MWRDGLRAVTRPGWRRALFSALAAPLALFLLFLLLDLLFPFPFARLARPAAVVVSGRDGQPLRFFLPADERWRLPVTLDEVPPDLLRALVASEDRRFWRHPGVDPLAILRAAWTDLRAGRVVSGASTLPMQLARLADPAPRTLAAKGREAFRALQLTWHLSKRRQLELYLNVTPYGGNLEGVGAASYFYFGKRPAQLSLGEMALLVALPRSPTAYSPVRDPAAALAARDRVLGQLARRGAFPPRAMAEARRQPLPGALHRPPFLAPHFCRLAVQLSPGKARVPTGLDPRLQDLAERQVAARIGELRARGIGNAAVVVIENQTHVVRALVGSAGFFDTEHSGQVDGTLARRSPGSTLKPFLYALAFESGRLLPDSFLLDVPTDYAGYVPENYDGRYRGRVTARAALIQSLNAPAVRLLRDVGLPDFVALLRRGGLDTLDRPLGEYGLPLILGAGEVRLIDLANLYAGLADGGVHHPWTLGPEPSPGPGERLFSEETAYLVTSILSELRRPDLPSAWELTRDVPAVAWKTGTSFGHRDAWAVGFSRRFSIGVWVGNFDGRAVKGISGSEDAGPLLFDLLRALEGGPAGPQHDPRGLRIESIEVCAESHELPGPYCPARVRIPYLPGRSRLVPCTVHRRVFVDREDGRLLAGDCLGRRPFRPEVLDVYPSELVAWWRAQGQPVTPLPALSPACGGVPSGEGPKIVSPDAATPYRVRREAPLADQRIPLIARAGPHAAKLYWYQDGLLVATGAPGERLFLPPERGSHKLVVVDDAGRADSLRYQVD